MDVHFEYSEKSNTCTVQISDPVYFQRLRDHFSIPNEGKKFIRGPQRHWMPDFIYFITPTGKFPFGMAELVIQWLKDNVHDQEVEYTFSDSYNKRFLPLPNIPELVNNLKLTPREYQKDVVKLALKYRFGTFVMGTGAGKTLTISSILDNLFHNKLIKRALIIVPDNGLVMQFNDELKNQYGMSQKITMFFGEDNKIDKTSDIIIANRPLFLSRFDENKNFFVNDIDCLIVDEAHSIKRSNKISKQLEKLQAFYRFGFTGTLAENKEDKIKNIGLLGPVRYEKTSKELRDEGFLTNVNVQGVTLHYSNPEHCDNYREEVEWLQVDPERNKFLTKLLFKLKNNSLIMVNYLNHGFTLQEEFNKENEKLGNPKKVYFIRGEIETEAREVVKKLMEKEDNIICIAITKIFSTGINIKNLHNIVLASGGKSSVTVVQSIGRGLRLHPNKKMLNIWDISDFGYKYSQNHAVKRQEIYKKEKINFIKHDVKVS